MGISIVLQYATLAACALFIAQAVRRYDLHTREPIWALGLATLLGAGGMWLAGQTQLAVITSIHRNSGMISDPALAFLAGSTEELAKLAAVALVLIIARRHFNETLDGLIYGSFAGLGAAIEESIAILGSNQGISTLPPQEPVRLAGHLIMGGIAAAGLGAFAAGHRRGRRLLITCFLAAVALHTIWDVVAFGAEVHFRATRSQGGFYAAAPIALMIAGMIGFRRLISIWGEGACLSVPHATGDLQR